MNVLIGIASQDYAHIYFSLALARLCKFTSHSTILSLGRGSVIADNRNTLVHSALVTGADFLLMIDNDVSFPADTLDRLVDAAQVNNFDVVGGSYLKKVPPHKQTSTLKKDLSNCTELENFEEAEYLPAGMMLVRSSVFNKLEQPYFFHEPMLDPTGTRWSVSTEDCPFCYKVHQAGMQMWLDVGLSLELVHWMGTMGVQWTMDDPGYKYVTTPPDHITR